LLDYAGDSNQIIQTVYWGKIARFLRPFSCGKLTIRNASWIIKVSVFSWTPCCYTYVEWSSH